MQTLTAPKAHSGNPRRMPEYRRKLRPHSDFIRRQLEQLQPLQGLIVEFSSDWRPCHTWYHDQGFPKGIVYAVRIHRGKTFVFRLE